MTICGLVITVDCKPNTLEELKAQSDLQLGACEGTRLPAVLETDDRRSFLRRWDELLNLEGVLALELAYAHYALADEAALAEDLSHQDAT